MDVSLTTGGTDMAQATETTRECEFDYSEFEEHLLEECEACGQELCEDHIESHDCSA